MIGRVFALTAALALLGACTTTTQTPATCDVTLKFGSYGLGVDRPLADAVDARTKADRELAHVARQPWGREGEYDLCLSARPGRDTRAIYERYRAMLPVQGLKAPTSITGPEGQMYETSAPM